MECRLVLKTVGTTDAYSCTRSSAMEIRSRSAWLVGLIPSGARAGLKCKVHLFPTDRSALSLQAKRETESEKSHPQMWREE